MNLHHFLNTHQACAEDAAHTIERVRALVPDDPHRYDQARTNAIAWLGCRWVFHRGTDRPGSAGCGAAERGVARQGKARGL
jgi:hypothetical protein